MINWEHLLDMRRAREELGLSQRALADLLGVSPRTIQSCEQGWRKPSAALERSLLLLLLALRNGPGFGRMRCWDVLRCDPGVRQRCFTFRSRQGHLCWLLSGNMCGGRPLRSWRQKKAACGECAFLRLLLGETLPARVTVARNRAGEAPGSLAR